MKAAGRYLLCILVTCALFAAGIWLPQWLVSHEDRGRIGKVRSESLEIPETVSHAGTSIIDKIGLLNDGGKNVTQVLLKRGTNLDTDSAGARFFQEVRELVGLDLLPPIDPQGKISRDGESEPDGDTDLPAESVLDGETGLSIEVGLYVQNDAPSVSAVLWNMIWREGDFSGNFHMDDETGKILQFSVLFKGESPVVDENAMEAWARYLGLEARNTEEQPESFLPGSKYSKLAYTVYRCELISRDKVLPYLFYHSEREYGFGYSGELWEDQKKDISSVSVSIQDDGQEGIKEKKKR